MEKSIFEDKGKIPCTEDVVFALKQTSHLWVKIIQHIKVLYPEAIEEWNFAGEKYGWSFRVKDKKRVIVYFLPRSGYFKVAFVFGQKATDTIMQSKISDAIKEELASAKVYAEGRGIRIDVKNEAIIEDIKLLIKTKLS